MDREKVISTFEKIISVCKEDGCDFVDLTFEDAEQILELLQEQEAVEPKKTAYQRVDHTIACLYRCGMCDMSIFPSYKYCPFCGQAVKWE